MSRSPPRFPGVFPISWVFYEFFLVSLTQLFCWCIAALFALSINLTGAWSRPYPPSEYCFSAYLFSVENTCISGMITL